MTEVFSCEEIKLDKYQSSICCYSNLGLSGQPPLQEEIPLPLSHSQS